MSEQIEGYLEASLDLEEHTLYLDGSCIGAEVEFEYKGKRYVICFPSFDLAGLDKKKEDDLRFYKPKSVAQNTRIRLNWLERTKDRPYGHAYINAKTKTVNRFSCNRIIIRSVGKMTFAEARQAKKDLEVWKSLFIAWQQVLKFKDLTATNLKVEQENEVESYLVELPNDGFEEVGDIGAQPKGVNIIASAVDYFSQADIKKTLSRCSLDTLPPDPHLRIISALKLYNNDDYRQSLFDSATAVEISLTALLDMRLDKVEAAVRNLLLDKYSGKGINFLLIALKELKVVINDNELKTRIATPRNRAIHEGVEVSSEQAKDALNLAKDFIYSQLKV